MLNITEWLIRDSNNDVPITSMVMFFVILFGIMVPRAEDEVDDEDEDD